MGQVLHYYISDILPSFPIAVLTDSLEIRFESLRIADTSRVHLYSRYMKSNNALGCFSHYYFRGDLKRAFNPLVCSHSIPETTTHNESTIGLSDVGMFLPTLQKIGYPESFNCCFSNSFKNVPMGNIIRPWMN